MNADKRAQLDQVIGAIETHIAVMKGQDREPDAWESDLICRAFGLVLGGWYSAAGMAAHKARAPADETESERGRKDDMPTLADLERGLEVIRTL